MHYFLTFCTVVLASVGTVLAQAEPSAPGEPSVEVVLSGDDDAGPAVLYDDEQITQKALGELAPGAIGSIEILSGEEAEARYGKYAEHGAIVVLSPANAPAISETVSGDAPAESAGVEAGGPTMDMPEDAYILIDGEPSSMEQLRALAPTDIDQVQVHKGQQAVELFGAKAKQGAVVVVTKS